jgi:hypothetical protein
VPNITGAISAVSRRIGDKCERALKAGGDKLFEYSQIYVPKDTTALAQSGAVRVDPNGVDTVVVVGYAKPSFVLPNVPTKSGEFVTRRPADYAYYVHTLPASHDHPEKHGFLQDPCHDHRDDIAAAVRTEFTK